ncbi:MAG: FGGY-family carbohydrate kinase [Treponema sp.]|jgi:autoinducer 2 (AI-2) kinase|nr:FGGY-family carbohydrate kinase [Treponema sp.]
MSSYIAAFDIGTGAGKCAIFNEKGETIGVKYEEWSYKPCPWGAKGGLVFDSDDFFVRLCGQSRVLIEETGIRPRDIIAAAASSQRQGMVFIDTGGRELYSAPCVDLRGEAMLGEILPHAEDIKNITGIIPHGMFGLPRLLWFKKHAPEVLQNTHRLLMLSDWLVWRLTGNAISEPSVAGSSQLFDTPSRRWSSEIAARFDLPQDIFPPVISASTPGGKLTKEAARSSGLPQDIPVFSTGGDTQAALAGMGVLSPGILCAVAGSTTPVMLTVDRPLNLEHAETDCHVTEHLWCLEANVKFSGLSLRWTRDRIPPKSSGNPFAEMSAIAAAVPIGAGGVSAYLGSEIAGELPGEKLGGFIFPVPWNIDEVTTAQLYRAAFESTIYPVRANAEYLLEQTGIHAETFLVCGGQTKSELYVQGLADVLNKTIMVSGTTETTALGAALSAAVGTGLYTGYDHAAKNMVHGAREYKPIQENVEAYDRAYRRWRSLRSALRNIKEVT